MQPTLAFALCARLAAQDPAPAPDPAAPVEPTGRRWGHFLAGAVTGLLVHEAGHVGFDLALGAGLGLKRVDYAGLPFFAISHDPVSPRKEYAIAQAGFLAQHVSNEWLLAGPLRRRPAPFRKGWLAMNLATSAAYAWASFTRTGPPERDTRGLADAARVDERVIGALVLAPAALDAWRYARPAARAPRWASRALKVGLVLLVLRARD